MSSIADVPRQSLCGGETVNDKLSQSYLSCSSLLGVLITKPFVSLCPVPTLPPDTVLLAANLSILPYNLTLSQMTALRIMSIFVILITSMLGAFFPIVSRRVKKLHVHESIYTFCRYFGSGVIVSTAFVHLLAPAFTALSSPCLSEA